MKTEAILKEIKSLPTRERITVIEKTLELIKSDSDHEVRRKMAKAAKALAKEYKENSRLTDLTLLDSEEFHEAG
jgi:hypothetical protein